MPNEFLDLRARARDRRDTAIAQIRAEYEETLRQIEQLEQRILGRPVTDKAKLSASVERVIPRDEQFTIADLMRKLEALDPGRVWPKVTVARHINRLRELGLVRRVQRHQANQAAIFVRSNGKAETLPNDKTLKDVIDEVVTAPMRTAEVVAALLEHGWKTTMTHAHFRTHVLNRLRACGFREVGGKWSR